MDPFSVADWDQYLSPEKTKVIDREALKNVKMWEDLLAGGEEILEPEVPTSFRAIAEANLVKKPTTKIKIFAKSRGISPDKYQFKDGKFIFEKDGKLYEETAPFWKEFAAETITDPTSLGGTVLGGMAAAVPGIGVPAVIGAGILGGMGGTYARQEIAKQAYGERMEPGARAMESAVSGLAGAAGEYGAKKIQAIPGILKRGAQRFAGATPITPAVPELLSEMGILEKSTREQIKTIQDNAKKAGIKLNLVESLPPSVQTGGLGKIAAGSPQQAQERTDYIRKKIPTFIKNIFPSREPTIPSKIATTPTAGEEIRKASDKMLKGITESHRAIVKPLYEATGNPVMSTKPIIEYIDKKAKTSIPVVADKLATLKKNLFTETKPEINLEQLDQFKKHIDKLLAPDAEVAIDKTVRREYQHIKKMALEEMDALSPQYKVARATEALLSVGEDMKKFAKSANISDTLIAQHAATGEYNRHVRQSLEPIADLSDDLLGNIGTYILTSSKHTPQTVNQIKNAVLAMPNGEKTWEKAMGDFLEFEASQIPVIEGKTLNFGEQWFKRVMGNQYKREVLKVALDKNQYKSLSNFMDIMRRTGIVFGGKTPEVPVEIPGHQELESIRKIALPLWQLESVITRKVVERLKAGDIKALTNVIYDPDVSKKLASLNMRQSTNKILTQFIRLMGWGASQQAIKETEEVAASI